MKLYHNYLDKFSCIGDECLGTCCEGWSISIDKKTWQKYQNIEGELGDTIRKGLIANEKPQEENEGEILLDKEKRCPFLNEKGLCDIYINCGEDYLSNTCTEFPRKIWKYENAEASVIFTSCEEVLRILKDSSEPVYFHMDMSDLPIEEQDASFFYLHEWIEFMISIIQDSSLPLSTVLGSITYMSMNSFDYIKKGEFEKFSASKEEFASIFNEFEVARTDLSDNELEQIAFELIFTVINSFCETMRTSEILFTKRILWADEIFQLDENKRREYIFKLLKEYHFHREQEAFVRKWLATQYILYAMYSEVKETKALFQDRWGTYILLCQVLPLTWGKEVMENEPEYLSRMAALGRIYNNTDIVSDSVAPVIDKAINPDVLTYAMAFMYIFS